MLKRVLDNKHTLIFSRSFPMRIQKNPAFAHTAILGIGGNIGDTVRRFERLVNYLRHSRFVQLTQTAPILKNPPFGYTDQADFYNSVMVVKTNLTPKALLGYILRIEKRFGRKRLFKDAPRTLDIDIIFFDEVQIESDRLTLPHPGWKERDSVLIPLSYLKGLK